MEIGEWKKIVAMKLFDLANLGAAALIFGEVAGREAIRWQILTVGALAFFILYGIAGGILWGVAYHHNNS